MDADGMKMYGKGEKRRTDKVARRQAQGVAVVGVEEGGQARAALVATIESRATILLETHAVRVLWPERPVARRRTRRHGTGA